MIYFFCALYEEAQFLIEAFQLKKNSKIHCFQLYESRKERVPKITLVITGVGTVASAVAVGYLAAMDNKREETLLINIGTCGSGERFPVGTVILGNKLWNEATGRSYYPDILFQHPFRETEIQTGIGIATVEKTAKGENVVFDMEAAGIYQAGSRFYRPDQMLFLKVVSDHGIREELPQEYQKEMLPFLNVLMNIQTEEETREWNIEAERLEKELHCSVTMAAEVEQLLRYVNLTGVNLHAVLEADRAAGILPCKDKKEGKAYLAQLKQRVL